MGIENKVLNFKTKHKMGFLSNEIDSILKSFPGISRELFDENVGIVTCMSDDSGNKILFHSDVIIALKKNLYDYKENSFEWD